MLPCVAWQAPRAGGPVVRARLAYTWGPMLHIADVWLRFNICINTVFENDKLTEVQGRSRVSRERVERYFKANLLHSVHQKESSSSLAGLVNAPFHVIPTFWKHGLTLARPAFRADGLLTIVNLACGVIGDS